MSTPAEICGRPRRAPVAAGSGVPVDRHEAYRRGLCRDCFAAWHSAGRPRCDACHDIYASSGGAAALTVVAGGRSGSGPWRPRPQLQLVKTA